MKTMKKGGVFAAAALIVVLITAALIFGCAQPMDGSGLGLKSSPTPAGQGRITINTGGGNSRTILPTTATITPATSYYYFKFIGQGSTADQDRWSLADDTSYTLTVPYGSYTLEVYNVAANNMDDTGDVLALGGYGLNAAGVGTLTSFTISATPVSGISVPLRLNSIAVTGTKTGKFSWNMDFTGMSSANQATLTGTMVLTAADSTTGTPPAIAAFTNNTTSNKWTSSTPTTIKEGYYNVLITLSRTSPTAADAYIWEFLHVYPNLESPFSVAYTDAIFPPLGGSTGAIVITPAVPGSPTFIITEDSSSDITGVVSGGVVTASVAASDTQTKNIVLRLTGGHTSIKWNYGAAEQQTGNTFTFSAGDSDFTNPGQDYIVTITAVTDSVTWSYSFTVKVTA